MKGTDTFSELVLRYRGLLFSVCHRYSRRGLDEDDLLQEVLVAMWHRREKLFSIDSTPKQAAWVWHVARSTCVDLLRRTPLSYPTPEGYDQTADDTAQHEALMELIALLPEPDRTIVTMHLEGYDHREIGRQVGMTRNNIGVRLMRIKEKLKQQWEN